MFVYKKFLLLSRPFFDLDFSLAGGRKGRVFFDENQFKFFEFSKLSTAVLIVIEESLVRVGSYADIKLSVV